MNPDGAGRWLVGSKLVNFVVVGLGFLLSGCAHQSRTGGAPVPAAVAPALPGDQPSLAFSTYAPGALLIGGWLDTRLGLAKTPTEYRLRQDPDSGKTVLFARAARAASGMMHPVKVRLVKNHQITWRWKISGLIDAADNTSRQHEDSPVRIVLTFAGDRSNLGFRDQLFFEQAKLLSGHEVPYATLMYIWENRQPVGTVIQNPHTGRVRMIVAESGPKRVGEWLEYTRDIRADYIKAFGEEPGQLEAVGVLTDSDNTGATTEAYYGNIRLIADAR
jgi:hypothetical protein